MPFITEELWHNLCDRKEGESIMVTTPNQTNETESRQNRNEVSSIDDRGSDEAVLEGVETLKAIVSGVRNIRASKNIPQKEVLTLCFDGADTYEYAELLQKLANVAIAMHGDSNANCAKFIVGTTEFAIPMDKFINVDEELKKLEADLAHQQGFLKGVMAKLSNERFVQNAKPEIVALEQKKKADAESRIKSIEEAIKALKG